jgi:DNA adenine methylase
MEKLAIHQLSYSGLGTKSGGPLGGEKQNSDYKIDCRWSTDSICRKIFAAHSIIARHEIRTGGCTCLPFDALIHTPGEAFLYLDPPYFVKGDDLYQIKFSSDDHRRLAQSLLTTSHHWVLSYDDCPDIHNLYAWAHREPVIMKYSITATKDETGRRDSTTKVELLIALSAQTFSRGRLFV